MCAKRGEKGSGECRVRIVVKMVVGRSSLQGRQEEAAEKSRNGRKESPEIRLKRGDHLHIPKR